MAWVAVIAVWLAWLRVAPLVALAVGVVGGVGYAFGRVRVLDVERQRGRPATVRETASAFALGLLAATVVVPAVLVAVVVAFQVICAAGLIQF